MMDGNVGRSTLALIRNEFARSSFIPSSRSARRNACDACSLATAAFFVSVTPQFGFWPLRPLRADRAHSLRIAPTPGLWRGSQRCGGASNIETSLTRRQTMQKGTVKWFNPTKGYGFIRPSTGDKDAFVHISAVERAGLSTLNEGQTLEYELVTNRGRTSAANLKVNCRDRMAAQTGRRSRRVAHGQAPGVFVLWCGRNEKSSIVSRNAVDDATSIDHTRAAFHHQAQGQWIETMLDRQHARGERLGSV